MVKLQFKPKTTNRPSPVRWMPRGMKKMKSTKQCLQNWKNTSTTIYEINVKQTGQNDEKGTHKRLVFNTFCFPALLYYIILQISWNLLIHAKQCFDCWSMFRRAKLFLFYYVKCGCHFFKSSAAVCFKKKRIRHISYDCGARKGRSLDYDVNSCYSHKVWGAPLTQPHHSSVYLWNRTPSLEEHSDE